MNISNDENLHELPKVNFLNDVRLFNEILNNSGEILVFDFRKKKDFEEANFTGYSLNIPFDDEHTTFEFCSTYDPSAWDILTDSDKLKKMLKRIRRYYVVIATTKDRIDRSSILELLKKLKNNIELNDQEEAIFKGLIFYNMLIQNKIREIGFFTGHYEEFIKHYNSILIDFCGNVQSKVFADPYPSSILDNRLYVGDESHVKNIKILKLLEITHIINVTCHAPNYFEKDKIKYLNIKIEDQMGQDFYPHFQKAYEFIESAFFEENMDQEDELGQKSFKLPALEVNEIDDLITIHKQKISEVDCILLKNEYIQLIFKKMLHTSNSRSRVLIHCSLGVSRSPSIAVMYIMKKFNLSFREAFDIVKLQRNKSCPIQSFCYELERFEKSGFSFILPKNE